jgi:hypothetical protein
MRPLIPSSRLLHTSSRFCAFQVSKFSTTPTSQSSASPSTHVTKPLNARWLNDTKSRLGKCITFGLTAPQVNEAGTILKELAAEWRELVAGSEGFLTAEGRRGLWNHAVVWGEMDSMVCRINGIAYGVKPILCCSFGTQRLI